MSLIFLLSGSCLTMKMAHGLRWGPSGPATSLRGNMCWVCDPVAGGGGAFKEVSVSVGELDEGEGEGQRGGG